MIVAMKRTLVLTLAVLAPLAAACSALENVTGSVDQGDCLKKSDKTFDEVGCDAAEATHVVLERRNSRDECATVAGVTFSYSDYVSGKGSNVCVGDKGADVSKAVNVAKEGDCLTANQTAKVACTAPDAVDRVLKVVANPNSITKGRECDEVPGTESTYTWSLKDPDSAFAKFSDDVMFCLAPKDVDPAKAIDNAKVGDCVTGGNTPTLVACTAPDADYTVVKRADVALSGDVVCKNTGATQVFTKKDSLGIGGITLCLGPA